MEETFVLKYYGGFSLEEQAYLNAEDRKFFYERIIEEIKRQSEAKSAHGGLGGSQFS